MTIFMKRLLHGEWLWIWIWYVGYVGSFRKQVTTLHSMTSTFGPHALNPFISQMYGRDASIAIDQSSLLQSMSQTPFPVSTRLLMSPSSLASTKSINPFAQHHFRNGKTRIVIITPQPQLDNTHNPSWSPFRTKPDQHPVLWKDIIDKLNEKLYYDQFNDKYEKQDREDIVLETVYIPLQSSVASNEADDQEVLDLLSQYTEENVPIVILIGLQGISSSFDIAIRSLCRQAQVVTSFQCETTFQALEYYGEYQHRQPKWKQILRNVIQRVVRFTGMSSTSSASSSFPSKASTKSITNPKATRDEEATLKQFEQQFATFQTNQSTESALDLEEEESTTKLPEDNRYEIHQMAYQIIQEMWSRESVEDYLFMLYVLLDSFSDYPIKSVKAVTNSANTSLKQIKCMCQNCAKEMTNCFKDPQCRKALNCLNKCRGNDQVCAYRCITSYESEAFQAFANCILQKNNCMGNKALMPAYPDPRPMEAFRGQPLNWDTADQIFIGFLDIPNEAPNPLVDTTTQSLYPWSWKVVCGQNPAYDTFAAQHQIFYPNRNTSSNATYLWYDPVFQVTTLSGEDVWRRRHYFVRRAKLPGQYFFTDNGVRSNELWRILDCADDLSWAVFYYSGAASVAGISYQGSLVATPDGRWPNMTLATKERINNALARGKISPWELFEVHWNVSTLDAPLGVSGMTEQELSVV